MGREAAPNGDLDERLFYRRLRVAGPLLGLARESPVTNVWSFGLQQCLFGHEDPFFAIAS
jgi:hypothetical protein